MALCAAGINSERTLSSNPAMSSARFDCESILFTVDTEQPNSFATVSFVALFLSLNSNIISALTRRDAGSRRIEAPFFTF